VFLSLDVVKDKWPKTRVIVVRAVSFAGSERKKSDGKGVRQKKKKKEVEHRLLRLHCLIVHQSGGVKLVRREAADLWMHAVLN